MAGFHTLLTTNTVAIILGCTDKKKVLRQIIDLRKTIREQQGNQSWESSV